jgi:hypothetical protein
MAEPEGVATNSFSNNSALYGDDYATDLARLVYVHGEGTQEVFLESFDEEQAYIVQLHDQYGHLVPNQDVFVSVSVSSDSHSCGDEVPHVSGKTLTETANGLAELHFASHCYPGGAVALSFSASGLETVQDLPLGARFRGCYRGEFYRDGACHECSPGSYSLLPNDDLSVTECAQCPRNADCQGASIVVRPGYWRLALNTSVVFQCPLSDGCLGE